MLVGRLGLMQAIALTDRTGTIQRSLFGEHRVGDFTRLRIEVVLNAYRNKDLDRFTIFVES